MEKIDKAPTDFENRNKKRKGISKNQSALLLGNALFLPETNDENVSNKQVNPFRCARDNSSR